MTSYLIFFSWIKDTAKAGFPKKANDIKCSVQKFLKDNPRPNPFVNNRPGEGWLKVCNNISLSSEAEHQFHTRFHMYLHLF